MSQLPDSTPQPSAGNAAPDPAMLQPPVRQRRPYPKSLEMRYHWIFLVISVIVLTLSFLLDVNGPTQVSVPGLGHALPPLCTFQNLTGIDCPGCGMTRSFISIAHGRWMESLRYHPIGWLVFGLVVAQVPFRFMQLTRLRRGLPARQWPGAVWMGWGVMILLVVQWVVRNAMGV